MNCTECNVLLTDDEASRNHFLNMDKCIQCALRYRYCPGCAEFLLMIDMKNGFCRPCFRSNPQRGEYHLRIETSLLGLEPTKRYFGVELETEVKTGSDKAMQDQLLHIDDLMGDSCIMKRDGSLDHGIEIVTRPYGLEKQYIIWDKFLRAKHPGLVSWDSSTCGMHVHVSRNGLSEQTISRAVCFINAEGNKKFMYVIAGRKDNGFAAFKLKTFDEAGKYSGHRHEAVNLGNEDTIEFRMFKGTLKRESVFKNLEFCDAILDFCNQDNITLTQAMSRAGFIRFVNHGTKWPHLSAFIMSRWYGKETELSKEIGWKAHRNCTVKEETTLNLENE
jgi:hypothetical protein